MSANPAKSIDRKTWTVLEILTTSAEFFKGVGLPSARLEAELLLAHALGIDRIQLYVQYDRPLVQAETATYRSLVKRRANGEPVQYLLGERDFWTLTFEVTPGVLIPRPDTETLITVALDELDRLGGGGASDSESLRVADVGTGSGCIGVTLAHERSTVTVWAGDVAEVPLELAPRNAARAGVSDRVQVLAADGLEPLWHAAGRRPFHVVASNPPYLTEAEMPGLMREVRDHEPHRALVAGVDGLDVIRPLIQSAAAPGRLVDGGALVIEVSSTGEQADRVRGLMQQAGLIDARVVPDLAGRPRVVVARRANR